MSFIKLIKSLVSKEVKVGEEFTLPEPHPFNDAVAYFKEDVAIILKSIVKDKMYDKIPDLRDYNANT